MATPSAPPGIGHGQQTVIMRVSENQSSGTWVSSNADSSNLWIPVQQDQKPFQCGLCSVTFDINVDLVSHIHNHSLTKPYQCGYCKVSYDNNPELIVHVKTHSMFMIHVPPSSTEVDVTVSDSEPVTTVLPANPNPSGLTFVSETIHVHAVQASLPESNLPSTGSKSCTISNIRKLHLGLELNNDLDRRQPSLYNLNTCSRIKAKSETALETPKNCKKKIKHEHIDCSDIVKSDPCQQIEIKTEHSVDIETQNVQPTEEDPNSRMSEGKPFGCDICGATFRLARYAQDHKRRIHKVVKICKKERMNTTRPFLCDICGASFRLARYAQDHRRRIHKQGKSKKSVVNKNDFGSGERPFRCDVCDVSFSVARYVTDHKRRVHKMTLAECRRSAQSLNDDVAASYDCPLCPFKFKHRYILQNHIAKVHKNQRPFICPHCRNGFKTKYELANHVNRKHNTETPHQCPDCGKCFKVKKDLNQHFCKPKECPICNHPLNCAASYYNHMRRIHSKVQFQCNFCEFSGILTRREVEQHTRTHPSAKPYICEICGQSFTRLVYLTYHRNGLHLNNRPYKCSICQKGFNSHPSLRMHKRRHTGDKRYPCDKCDKKFYNSCSLQRHAVTHTDLRMHGCSVCGKTYRSRSNLVYHLKHAHQF